MGHHHVTAFLGCFVEPIKVAHGVDLVGAPQLFDLNQQLVTIGVDGETQTQLQIGPVVAAQIQPVAAEPALGVGHLRYLASGGEG